MTLASTAARRRAPAAKYPMRERSRRRRRRRGEKEKKITYSETNTPPPPPQSSRPDLKGRKQFQLRGAVLLQVLMEMNGRGGLVGGGGAELCRVMAHIPHDPPMLLSGSGAPEETASDG